MKVTVSVDGLSDKQIRAIEAAGEDLEVAVARSRGEQIADANMVLGRVECELLRKAEKLKWGQRIHHELSEWTNVTIILFQGNEISIVAQ